MKPGHPTEDAYAKAAEFLGCEVAALKAIAQVEAGSMGAFDEQDRPVILFEAHVFNRLTGGRFLGYRAPGIKGEAGVLARAEWKPGTYGPSRIQHDRLTAAGWLDRTAALMSASWGLFQIMGENHTWAGYPSLQQFVNAAYRSADDHLLMLVNFIKSDGRLVRALQRHDWSAFARIYNGPGYRANKYDEKMAAAYGKLR